MGSLGTVSDDDGDDEDDNNNVKRYGRMWQYYGVASSRNVVVISSLRRILSGRHIPAI